MVDKTPPPGYGSPQGPQPNDPKNIDPDKYKHEITHKKGGGFHYPTEWGSWHLTEEQAKKLWTNMMNMVNSQIQRDKARMLKALKKLKKAEKGES